jgi:hypothetical protein
MYLETKTAIPELKYHALKQDIGMRVKHTA